MAVVCVSLLIIYVLLPDLPALLYSSLPESLKNPLWFAICWVQEANQLLYSALSVSFIFQLHILLPVTHSRELKFLAEGTGHCGGGAAEMEWIIRRIRAIQLLVNMFNFGHRNVIYCIKLLCITLAIVNGYGAIANGGSNVVYLLLASSTSCDMIFLYAFVYEKAFAIPDGFERVKHALVAESRGLRWAQSKKILLRQVRSIPSVGLRVGDFHVLERESTPVLVDYVLKNIVNLLVSL